jgi:hypothetical protein
MLTGLIPLFAGLLMAGFFYWECFGPNADSPSNDRRQMRYIRHWVWPNKPVGPRAVRRWNGLRISPSAGFSHSWG